MSRLSGEAGFEAAVRLRLTTSVVGLALMGATGFMLATVAHLNSPVQPALERGQVHCLRPVRLDVKAEAHGADAAALTVTVTDMGVGIARDAMARLFDALGAGRPLHFAPLLGARGFALTQ